MPPQKLTPLTNPPNPKITNPTLKSKSSMVGDSSHSAERRPRILTVFESREGNYPIVEDYIKAAQQRNWEVCYLGSLNSSQIARLDFADIPLDHVIYRGLSNNTHEIERLLAWLKANHKITINTNVAGHYSSCSDKHFQQGLFQLDPFLSPYALPTYEAKFKRNVLAYLKNQRFHYPFLLKERRGSIGRGITLIKEEKDLDQIQNFSNLLIEQYIRPECDFRIFVLGGVAIAVMRKYGDRAHPENFMAWSGGRRKYIETDPETLDILSEIATRATAATRLEFAGVDVMREYITGKYYLLEANVAAGWTNFASISKLSIAGLTIDWFNDIADGRQQPFHVAIETYLEHWRQYLPLRIQHTLKAIAAGNPAVLDPYRGIFATYPNRYLYDAGYLFDRLAAFYDAFTQHPNQIPDQNQLQNFLVQIESTPFSWAGNFIGPEVGTFHDGAILSALYLYLYHQLTVKNPQK